MTNDDLEDIQPQNTFAHSGTRMARDPEVWRYMDLLSLLALLQNRELHFTRLRDLQRLDPNEGTGGLSINLVRYPFTPSIVTVPGDERTAARERKEIAAIEAELRVPFETSLPAWREQVAVWDAEFKNMHVSCWHTSPSQSDFMWRLYAKHEFGFAVESSAKTVVEALSVPPIASSKIGWGFVVYPTRDQLIQERLSGSPLLQAPYIIKHPEFAHENEFRVFVKARDDADCSLPVDLKTLVKAIHISPLMPAWAHGAVAKTLKPICDAIGSPPIRVSRPLLR